MILESVIAGLPQKMRIAAERHDDIELTKLVAERIKELDEDLAWKLCTSLYPDWMSNEAMFVEMILQLTAESSHVDFWFCSHDTFKRVVSAHCQYFSSETVYGALAKCYLYAEYHLAMARLERSLHR